MWRVWLAAKLPPHDSGTKPPWEAMGGEMTPIRQWVLTALVAVALALSLSSPASADPLDGGLVPSGVWDTLSADPIDPGLLY